MSAEDHGSFYEPLGDGRFRSTVLTTGPWDVRSQHAGPPSALVAGRMQAAVDLPFARVTVEILRPVPVAELTVEVAVDRPGRAVTMVSGTVSDAAGPCVIARAWGIRRAPVGIPAVPAPEPRLANPEDCAAAEFALDHDGWHTGMELRFVSGGAFDELGPGVAWARPRVPIVAGHELTPIERVMAFADAGNGVSAAADLQRHLFINTDLTVHLHRLPVGEWVGLDARSVYEPDGVGAAFTTIHDEDGPIGRGAQALFLADRDPDRGP